MLRAAFLMGVWSSLSWAQTSADEEWKSLPPDTQAAPPAPAPPPVTQPEGAPELQVAPPLSPPEVRSRASDAPSPNSQVRASVPRPVLQRNAVSMWGALSLGQWNRGEMFYVGFPLVGLRFALGVSERVDVGVGLDSFYGMMNEPLLSLRVNFFRTHNVSLAATLEAGWAFFVNRASIDVRGARWLTGRRNGNIMPGFTVSYQGEHPRAARMFFSLRYLFTIDTEPYAKSPLGGVPSALLLGHNVLAQGGAEMPLSAKTAFVFLLGLEIHGRQPEDSPVMPSCSVGLVTSI